MYSRVSSMLRGSGRMIQRATTTCSLPLSKSLLPTLLKKVSVSRRKVASFLAGTRYQSGHLTEFCRKCSLCFRSTAVSWSGNPAFSIKEILRDSCSSTRLGTHLYSGDDSQSGRGTQANTYSDRPRPQGASSDPGEGALGPAQHELPAAARCPYRKPKTAADARESVDSPINERCWRLIWCALIGLFLVKQNPLVAGHHNKLTRTQASKGPGGGEKCELAIRSSP